MSKKTRDAKRIDALLSGVSDSSLRAKKLKDRRKAIWKDAQAKENKSK